MRLGGRARVATPVARPGFSSRAVPGWVTPARRELPATATLDGYSPVRGGVRRHGLSPPLLAAELIWRVTYIVVRSEGNTTAASPRTAALTMSNMSK
jgi:hypothetical protein